MMSNLWVLLFCTVVVCLMGVRAFGNVVLIRNNITLSSFDDVEANFAPFVKGSGMFGRVYVAEPLDACSPLNSTVNFLEDEVPSPFLLIVRGGCSFEEKVRRAQTAGFKAAIVFDNEDGPLVAMAGTSAGIKINAVFISKASGLLLKQYVGRIETEVWIIPSFQSSAWSIMAISFISLLAMSAVLATCFFVRRHRIRREWPTTSSSRVRLFHGMSSRLVKAMPSLIFTAVLEDNCTSSTCAICLEDYTIGERLRILPCRHKFHATCVDAWLTSWRTFCPVCKRDARTNTADLPASERTPLLSSTPASATSSMLSSFRSSYASSSAIQINPSSSARFPSSSHNNSVSTSYNQQSLQSYSQSPYLSPSRSSVDLRNAPASSSSQRSRGQHLASSSSMGYPCLLSSPLNSRHMMSPYLQSSCNGSVSYVGGSSSHRPSMLRHSESAQSFSPYASAQSLPDC